jgi:hypothetical protein
VANSETDGIHQIENGELTIENSAVYDLSGRKLSTLRSARSDAFLRKNSQLPTLPKGVYIIDGKKIVVK